MLEWMHYLRRASLAVRQMVRQRAWDVEWASAVVSLHRDWQMSSVEAEEEETILAENEAGPWEAGELDQLSGAQVLEEILHRVAETCKCIEEETKRRCQWIGEAPETAEAAVLFADLTRGVQQVHLLLELLLRLCLRCQCASLPSEPSFARLSSLEEAISVSVASLLRASHCHRQRLGSSAWTPTGLLCLHLLTLSVGKPPLARRHALQHVLRCWELHWPGGTMHWFSQLPLAVLQCVERHAAAAGEREVFLRCRTRSRVLTGGKESSSDRGHPHVDRADCLEAVCEWHAHALDPSPSPLSLSSSFAAIDVMARGSAWASLDSSGRAVSASVVCQRMLESLSPLTAATAINKETRKSEELPTPAEVWKRLTGVGRSKPPVPLPLRCQCCLFHVLCWFDRYRNDPSAVSSLWKFEDVVLANHLCVDWIKRTQGEILARLESLPLNAWSGVRPEAHRIQSWLEQVSWTHTIERPLWVTEEVCRWILAVYRQAVSTHTPWLGGGTSPAVATAGELSMLRLLDTARHYTSARWMTQALQTLEHVEAIREDQVSRRAPQWAVSVWAALRCLALLPSGHERRKEIAPALAILLSLAPYLSSLAVSSLVCRAAHMKGGGGGGDGVVAASGATRWLSSAQCRLLLRYTLPDSAASVHLLRLLGEREGYQAMGRAAQRAIQREVRVHVKRDWVSATGAHAMSVGEIEWTSRVQYSPFLPQCCPQVLLDAVLQPPVPPQVLTRKMNWCTNTALALNDRQQLRLLCRADAHEALAAWSSIEKSSVGVKADRRGIALYTLRLLMAEAHLWSRVAPDAQRRLVHDAGLTSRVPARDSAGEAALASLLRVALERQHWSNGLSLYQLVEGQAKEEKVEVAESGEVHRPAAMVSFSGLDEPAGLSAGSLFASSSSPSSSSTSELVAGLYRGWERQTAQTRLTALVLRAAQQCRWSDVLRMVDAQRDDSSEEAMVEEQQPKEVAEGARLLHATGWETERDWPPSLRRTVREARLRFPSLIPASSSKAALGSHSDSQSSASAVTSASESEAASRQPDGLATAGNSRTAACAPAMVSAGEAVTDRTSAARSARVLRITQSTSLRRHQRLVGEQILRCFSAGHVEKGVECFRNELRQGNIAYEDVATLLAAALRGGTGGEREENISAARMAPWEAALRCFDCFTQRVRPDVYAVVVAMEACSVGRQWCFAARLLRQAVLTQSHPPPRVLSLGLRTTLENGPREDALALARALRQTTHPELLHEVLEAYTRYDCWGEVVELGYLKIVGGGTEMTCLRPESVQLVLEASEKADVAYAELSLTVGAVAGSMLDVCSLSDEALAHVVLVCQSWVSSWVASSGERGVERGVVCCKEWSGAGSAVPGRLHEVRCPPVYAMEWGNL